MAGGHDAEVIGQTVGLVGWSARRSRAKPLGGLSMAAGLIGSNRGGGGLPPMSDRRSTRVSRRA